MNLLPFGTLPPHRTRQFVPGDIDLGRWEDIEPLFGWLEDRAGRVVAVQDLERWILDWGELTAALEEEGSRRHIAMTCHTDSPDAEKAYLHFVEEIEPRLKPRQFALSRLYLEHPLRRRLDRGRYGVFDRDNEVRVALFREENVPLETEEAKRENDYNKLVGGLTVAFRGEERTLPAMGRFLEEPDRALREEAWRAVAARRLEEATRFDGLMDGLLELRGRIARNAGFADYRDYAFRARRRFDYGPADCLRFHEAIETEVMPLFTELQEARRRKLGVESLRPWDTAVDPLARPPLKPFSGVDELEAKTQAIFDRLDSELAGQFRVMRHLRLLDLANRKGKAPGGYQSTLPEARLPFIFMNAVGMQRDVETLLHEAGHAFHAMAVREEDLHAYRNAPIEFCEVASMAMELLASGYLDAFYEPAEVARARRVHLEGVVGVFPWIATVDAFQHWLYAHPGHTAEERAAAWAGLMSRFGGAVDWGGLEAPRDRLWHRQLHIFLYPFYYVEYGIAQLGALQVWANARRDPAQALARYKSGLALGGARPLPELFGASGCRFDFSAETLRPLMALVREELSRLG